MDSEERFQYVLLQICDILREILANIKYEQQALHEGNLDLLNKIIEERLDFLEIYEKFAEELMAYTDEIRNNSFPSHEDFAGENTFEWLSKLIAEDNISLQLTLNQIKNLIDEIHKQNKITLSILKTRPVALSENLVNLPNPFSLIKSEQQLKQKKISLALLDPFEKEEKDL